SKASPSTPAGLRDGIKPRVERTRATQGAAAGKGLVQAEGDPEPKVAIADRGIARVAERRAAAPAVEGPRAAAQDATLFGALLAIKRVFKWTCIVEFRVVIVRTPLQHVAVHVVQPEPILLIRPHGTRPLQGRPFHRRPIGVVPVAVSLFA